MTCSNFTEEPLDWNRPPEKAPDKPQGDRSSSSASSDSDSDFDLDDRLRALLDLNDNLDRFRDLLESSQRDTGSSGASGPKHRHVQCDGCGVSSFSGSRFRCGYV